MYKNFVARLAGAVAAEIARVEAIYGFDYGPEFEVAICEVLRRVLPSKYGVCRGFAVAATGQVAGDDIIIYDRANFPTLRFLVPDRFDRKEHIPVEAIYAYLEAKHTLYLDGTGGQSYTKAATQIAAVKALPRNAVPLNQLAPGVSVGYGMQVAADPGLPGRRNPLYGGIVARKVCLTEQGKEPLEKPGHILARPTLMAKTSASSPDVVVLGADMLMLPATFTSAESPAAITVFSEVATNLWPCSVKGRALAVGLVHLFIAMEKVLLGPLPWGAILMDELQSDAAPAGSPSAEPR